MRANEAADPLGIVVGLALRRGSADARPVVGIGGSVAVGKTTFATELAAALRATGVGATVVGTDGFLLPNEILERNGTLLRKGFPESYDTGRLVAFVRNARAGAATAVVPCYSHELFDISGTADIRLDEVVIVEGVNALQPAIAAQLTCRIYVNADERLIFSWFADRFTGLIAAAETDERSFYRRFVPLDASERAGVIRSVWDTINAVNLHEHIRPTADLADAVVQLRADHTILQVDQRAGAGTRPDLARLDFAPPDLAPPDLAPPHHKQETQ